MEHFDKNMAAEMIEDALQAVSDPIGRGIAVGLCSAFYLCGMIEKPDWEKYQKCMPPPHASSTPSIP